MGDAMVQGNITRLIFSRERLGHADVLGLGREILTNAAGRVVVLDLRETQETTTAALAGLILLRREAL